MRRLLLSALLAFAVLAVPAQGATVTSSATTFHDPGGKGFPETWITTRTVDVVAVPGEANQIVVSAAGGVVTVQDAGGPLGAGAGCVGAGAGAVTCSATDAQVLKLTARLGDGNDRLEVSAPGMRATVDAGPGDDVVTGKAGGELDGGEGDDTMSLATDTPLLGATGVLRGGPGADTLTGSGSSDVIDGGTGTDVLDGGEGADTLSYAGRPDAVTIDLGAPTAGATGEADKIAAFEVAEGGDGNDVLTPPAGASGPQGVTLIGGPGDDAIAGSGGRDRLEGEEGADRLTAGGGDDYLEGGDGDDVLDGGEGTDFIVARNGADLAHGGRGKDEISDVGDDGGAGDVFHGDEGNDELFGTTVHGGPGNDKLYGAVIDGGEGDDTLAGPRSAADARALDCGPGRDVLLDPKDRVVLPAGCERVDPWTYGGTTLRVPPRIEKRRVTVAMPNPCLYAYVDARCRVKAALFVGGRHVGTREPRWRRERDGGRVLRWVLPRRARVGDVLRLRLVKYETDEPTERGGYSVRVR